MLSALKRFLVHGLMGYWIIGGTMATTHNNFGCPQQNEVADCQTFTRSIVLSWTGPDGNGQYSFPDMPTGTDWGFSTETESLQPVTVTIIYCNDSDICGCADVITVPVHQGNLPQYGPFFPNGDTPSRLPGDGGGGGECGGDTGFPSTPVVHSS